MGETIVFLRDKRELWDHCRGAGVDRVSSPTVRPSSFKPAEAHPLNDPGIAMASTPVEPPLPIVPFKNCPIPTSHGGLGRKGSLLIIRAIRGKRACRSNT